MKLNRDQTRALDALTHVAETLTALDARELEGMKDHVNERGTDSDGGAAVDDLVVAFINAARDAEELRGQALKGPA